jgi:hypothetical protein
MRARLATAPARPGAANEDFAAVSPSAAVLLDGAGIPRGLESGCVHGVAWFARTLGALLLAEAGDPAARPLADCLARAIGGVRLLHEGACDLAHPGSPTATVIAIRIAAGQLEYLVLADSSLILTGTAGDTEVITDRRLDEVLRGTRDAIDRIPLTDPGYADAFREHILAVRHLRNSPGGFWVASPDPAVAEHALTGLRPLAGLDSALLLSDGASRPADLFGLAAFADLVAVAAQAGPAELIRQVRAAEATDLDGRRWKRSKARDDATAVYCDQLGISRAAS